MSGQRVVSLLFHTPIAETAADLTQLVAHSSASLALTALRSLPSGKKLLEHPDLIMALEAITAGEADRATRKEALSDLLETSDSGVCRRTLIEARFENALEAGIA